MGSSSGNAVSSESSTAGESVIVVMDVHRGKGSLDALDWAIKYIVGPNDTIVVLGVLPELGKKSAASCLPFHVGISTSGIWIKLEFSGQGEMSPSELQEEIARKKMEYQKILQPFYHQCKKREVKLDINLAAGLESKKIAVKEADKWDPRWIVLDGYLKKDKGYIQKHVDCHMALLKSNGVATLIPSKITGPECQEWQTVCRKIDDHALSSIDPAKSQTEQQYIKPSSPIEEPPSPSSYPLSWRSGFPRAFAFGELEEMTNGFSIFVVKDQHRKVYRGFFRETPVIVMSFLADDDRAVSLLKIVSRVRHRSILNLVGYCRADDSIFLLCDLPCGGTLEGCLLCDELAINLSWRCRWDVALEIGAGIRYLHEECVDGSIVNLSICSAHVALTRNASAMLSIYQTTAKKVKHDVDHLKECLPAKCQNIDKHEHMLADVKDYGLLLLELISGQSKRSFEEKEGQSLVDWALPHLEENLISKLLDPRLIDTSEPQVAHMARAALLCLKNDSSHKFTISKVLAVVRGDQ